MPESIMNGLISAAVTICAAVFVLVVWRWSPMGKAQARRAITRHFTSPLTFFELRKPLPPRLREVGAALEGAGAVLAKASEVMVGDRGAPVANALYLADDGTILIEVVCGFEAHHPDPAIACMSQLAGQRGLLATETLRNAPELDNEILQVMPGATPGELLAEHRRALAALRDRGIGVETIDPQTATDALSWWASLTRAAWEQNGSVYADQFIANQKSNTHEQRGRILDRSDLDEKLRSLE